MYLITWITTHLPTSEGWMAELAETRSMQPYIILYKTTLQLGVRNLPKVFTRQRPGRESNRVSVTLNQLATKPHKKCNLWVLFDGSYWRTNVQVRTRWSCWTTVVGWRHASSMTGQFTGCQSSVAATVEVLVAGCCTFHQWFIYFFISIQ